jgi:hypothetical protein
MTDVYGNILCLSEGLKEAVGLSARFFLLENIKFKSRVHLDALLFPI